MKKKYYLHFISIIIYILILCNFKPFRFYQEFLHSYKNLSVLHISQLFTAKKEYFKSRLTNGSDFIKEFLSDIMKAFTIEQKKISILIYLADT